ncbi:MAG: lipoate--protein ligase family protein [Planctomycetota bacterium]
MRHLDLTLPTPAENVALDEALLEEAERAGRPAEMLRLWEPAAPMVVVGRSSTAEAEIHREACGRRGMPILRRCSGGAAVVTGPGCLMYSLVLSYRLRPELRAVDSAHRFVLSTLASALRPLVPEVSCRGTSDLVIGDRKFSGNSMRCKRDHFLYHGTLLYDFPLDLVEECLAMPGRQPEYRGGRGHADFVTNLPASRDAIRHAVIAGWDAAEPRAEWPREATARLVADKYGRKEWNEKR